MDALIFRVAAVGIASAFLALLLKKDNPVFAALIAISGSLILFFLIVPRFAAVFEMFRIITDNIGSGEVYIPTVLRIIGIAYAAEFGANICADAGEAGLASRVELAGKILILAASTPIIVTLLDQILRLT